GNRAILHVAPLQRVRCNVTMLSGTRSLVLVVLVVLPATAGEYAVLSSGFRMHVDSHESANGTVVLHMGQGTLQLPADQISQFEKDDYVPPAVPTAPMPVKTVLPS